MALPAQSISSDQATLISVELKRPEESSDSLNGSTEAHTGREAEINEGQYHLTEFDHSNRQMMVQAGQLRARKYIQAGFITPDQIGSDGCEFDRYDAHSDHFGLFAQTDEGEPLMVGYIRLIHRSRSGRLPVEIHFPEIQPEPNMTEVSRLVMDHDIVKDPQQRLVGLMTLIRSVTIRTIESGSPGAYATLESPLLKRLIGLGLKFEPAGVERQLPQYGNTLNYPVRIESNEALGGVRDMDLSFRQMPDGSLVNRGTFFSRFFENALEGKIQGLVMMEDFTQPAAVWERNRGFLSSKEQMILNRSTVSIAGTGGDGGELAISLARLGVGNFRLADPEKFELENINRQAGSNHLTIGENKAVAVAREIQRINPFATIRIFTDGVTTENIDSFVKGTDLVIDESEFTKPEIGVMIARTARQHKLPVLMAFNIGFGCLVTSFAPDGMTLEKKLGLSDTMPMDEVAKQTIGLERWVARIPSYVDFKAFKRVANGEISAPSVVQGVNIAGGVAATEAMLHLIRRHDPESRRPKPTIAPHYYSVDAIDGSRRIHHPYISFLTSVGRVVVRNAMHRNPQVSS